MTFKVGDKVIVADIPHELRTYGARDAAGKHGVIAAIARVDYPGDYDLRDRVTTKTLKCTVDFGPGHDKLWIFDFHLTMHEDSMSYDDWVKTRDWNRIYKEKTNQSLGSLFRAKS